MTCRLKTTNPGNNWRGKAFSLTSTSQFSNSVRLGRQSPSSQLVYTSPKTGNPPPKKNKKKLTKEKGQKQVMIMTTYAHRSKGVYAILTRCLWYSKDSPVWQSTSSSSSLSVPSFDTTTMGSKSRPLSILPDEGHRSTPETGSRRRTLATLPATFGWDPASTC